MGRRGNLPAFFVMLLLCAAPLFGDAFGLEQYGLKVGQIDIEAFMRFLHGLIDIGAQEANGQGRRRNGAVRVAMAAEAVE